MSFIYLIQKKNQNLIKIIYKNKIIYDVYKREENKYYNFIKEEYDLKYDKFKKFSIYIIVYNYYFY